MFLTNKFTRLDLLLCIAVTQLTTFSMIGVAEVVGFDKPAAIISYRISVVCSAAVLFFIFIKDFQRISYNSIFSRFVFSFFLLFAAFSGFWNEADSTGVLRQSFSYIYLFLLAFVVSKAEVKIIFFKRLSPLLVLLALFFVLSATYGFFLSQTRVSINLPILAFLTIFFYAKQNWFFFMLSFGGLFFAFKRSLLLGVLLVFSSSSRLFLVALLLGAIFIILAPNFFQFAHTSMDNKIGFLDAILSGRLSVFLSGILDVYRRDPVFGLGFGTEYLLWESIGWRDYGSDIIFSDLYKNFGLFGLLLGIFYLFCLYRLFYLSFRNRVSAWEVRFVLLLGICGLIESLFTFVPMSPLLGIGFGICFNRFIFSMERGL